MEYTEKEKRTNKSESLSSKPRFVESASRLLLDSCNSVSNSYISIFEVKKHPKISVTDYLERFVVHSEMEESTILVALILIDRLTKMTKIKLNMSNIHRILVTMLVIAIKTNEDIIYTNLEYAMIGGISSSLLNELEMNALVMLDWQVHVDIQEYLLYKDLLQVNFFR